MESIPGDFSKRVYQGVRVKHTVKDLLAEKRSRQTNNSRFNGGVTSQSPFTQVPGSPAMSGFYGIRRSFLSDSDFHSTKQYPGDVCGSGAAKAFPCEPSAGSSHPALLDPYFPEPYSDHRPSALTPSPGSLFSASPLPPLLPPPFPGDPSHLVLRDTWEQTMPEGLGQPDPGPTDTLPTLSPGTSCLSQLESGSASQHRSSSWAPALPGAPSYSLHALEDLYHSPGYPTPSSYPFSPFMTVSNDQPPKMVPDESTDPSVLQDSSPWTKEDGSMTWGSFECRRAY
ncbi:POU domain class 2-associating factor 2 [Sorex fumeus]|uniref:POU domain class 2-associating factor 2 n=1 Tax=Sorex fumeus TaxID=62283 RepID=UPI0024AE40B2|nr:POU domain class 2-associating factor 2 [Sorex fumeus]